MPAKKKGLKRFLSGVELEFFLLDREGNVSNCADSVLKKAKGLNPKASIEQECAKNMIELNHYPKEHPQDTIRELLETYEVLLDAANDLGILTLPLSCYPGTFEPQMRTGKLYGVKRKIFGAKKFKIAGRVTGFHYHHTLPRGVFDKERLVIKRLVNSKFKAATINAYNFAIAADPALSVLMASSPFYQSEHLGKDSRVFVYRGGRKLKYPQGLYSDFLSIGGLPPYKQTLEDLKYSMRRRRLIWKGEIRRAGGNPNLVDSYASPLDIGWNPVRINKHDTIEQRGIDMNFLDNVMGTTTLMNYAMDRIQDEFILVAPSEIGIDEPFKLEGKVLYIPPHTYLRNRLQYQAALHGFASKSAKRYSKRFVRFCRSCMPSRQMDIAGPAIKIADAERSVSDSILRFARRRGHDVMKTKARLPQPLAREIALHAAGQGTRRMRKTERILEKYL